MTAPTRCAALICGALFTVPVLAQEDAHLLRFTYTPGQVQFYRQVMDMTMKMDMGGTNMNTTMAMTMTTEMKVDTVKDGAADVQQTVRRLQVEMDNPMMQVEYDSDDPESDAGMLSQMTDIVGKTFRMTMDSRGKVTNVKVPDDFDASSAAMFSGGDMEQFFGQALPQLPENAVAVGAAWETKTEMPLGQMGKTEVKVQNKLLKVDGGKATIEQLMNFDTAGMELPQGAKVEIKKAGGTTVVDLKKGLLHESRSQVEMKMQASEGGMKMDMDMTMKMVMEAIDPPAPKTPKEGDKGK